jgi:adenylate cyclase
VSARLRILVLAAGVVAVVLGLFMAAPEFLGTVETKLYDLHFKLRGVRPPGDQIVIAAIDERSLASLGRWPWPRSVLARLITRLSEAGASAIAVDILLSEPEVSGERRAAERLAGRLAGLGLPPGSSEAVARELGALARESDHDAQLEEAIRQSERVVLPIVFDINPVPPAAPPEPKGPPLKSALIAFRHYDERATYPPVGATEAGVPIPPLAAAARELGHVTMIADSDGTTRWEALVFEYRGHYYPSLAVQAVRVAADIPAQGLSLDFGRGLRVGPREIPVDPRNRTLVPYAGPGGTFRHYGVADILDGRVPDEALRDRIVFVGGTAAAIYDLRVTPMSPILPGVEKHASVAASILEGAFLERPDWVELADAAGIVFLPLALAFVLARVRPLTGVVTVSAIWVGLFGLVHLAFRSGLWLPLVYPTLALGGTFVAVTVYQLLTEERQRLWIKRAFQRFVSPDVVEELVKNPKALQFGGEVRELTVLFTDIRDFTTYTERHAPQDVVRILQEYLTCMVEQVLAEKGTLDKFIGDAVMAIFGAPQALPDHALRACRAGLRMVAELERLQAKWAAEGLEGFQMGVGINTGEMVVGNLGSEQLFDYTVVGDGVNLGARLESLNKEHKTDRHIIISERTYEAAREHLAVRRLGEVLVKGKTRPVVIYELLGIIGDPVLGPKLDTAGQNGPC